MKYKPFGMEGDLTENIDSNLTIYDTKILQIFVFKNLDLFDDKEKLCKEFGHVNYKSKLILIKILDKNK